MAVQQSSPLLLRKTRNVTTLRRIFEGGSEKALNSTMEVKPNSQTRQPRLSSNKIRSSSKKRGNKIKQQQSKPASFCSISDSIPQNSGGLQDAKLHHLKPTKVPTTTSVLKKKTKGSRRKKVHKSVRFSDNLQVQPNKVPLSLVARRSVWYTKEEECNMESANNLVIMKMEKGEKTIGETKRGLECHTTNGKWKKYRGTRNAINIVLDEQRHQEQRRTRRTTKDAYNIAKLYCEATMESKREALIRGLRDAAKNKKNIEVLE